MIRHRFRTRLAFATATAAAALLLGLVPATRAHADAPADESGEEAQTHLQYPATAEVFRAHVNQRISNARARLEQHIVDQQVEPDKAAKLRARFQAAVVVLGGKVDAVCADGTVTHEEAHEVHELAKELRHHKQP